MNAMRHEGLQADGISGSTRKEGKAIKGILFKPDMIRAIRDGSKTQTRRLTGLKEINKEPDDWWLVASFDDNTLFRFANDKQGRDLMVKPRYRVGEVVYIKEAWWTPPDNRKETHHQNIVSYRAIIVESAGEEATKRNRWLSPLFMPAWAARYFVSITGVRAERLQEITEEDCKAEGIYSNSIYGDFGFHWAKKDCGYETAKTAYHVLWDSINPKLKWSINPWVWKYSFEEVKSNGNNKD